MYSLDPRDHEWVNNDTIFSWRQFLKLELLRQRGYVSDFSKKPFKGTVEMHEGILTRADVPKGVRWHYMIFCCYNSFLLTPEEHNLHGHQREWALCRAYELYGRDTIKQWFESLPWKNRPPFKLL